MKLRSLDALPGDYDGPRLVEHLHLTMAHNEAVERYRASLPLEAQQLIEKMWKTRKQGKRDKLYEEFRALMKSRT